MEIYFITTSYSSQIYFIITSYMKYGWIWWRILDTGLMQWLSKEVKDETFTCRVLLSVEAASLRWLGVISAK